jgi:hypothetical protein
MKLAVNCPGCGRAILLEEHEAGSTIECAVCDQRFVAGAPPKLTAPPVRSAPPSEGQRCLGCGGKLHHSLSCPRCIGQFCSEVCLNRHYKATQHHLPNPGEVALAVEQQRTRTAAMVLGIVAVCAVCCIGMGMVGLCGSILNPQPRETSHVPPKGKAANDPWPECQLCRDWLRDNTGDPASVEIIDWQDRRVIPKSYPGTPAGTVRVDVKYRAANGLGGKSVEVRHFFVLDGKIMSTTAD